MFKLIVNTIKKIDTAIYADIKADYEFKKLEIAYSTITDRHARDLQELKNKLATKK